SVAGRSLGIAYEVYFGVVSRELHPVVHYLAHNGLSAQARPELGRLEFQLADFRRSSPRWSLNNERLSLRAAGLLRITFLTDQVECVAESECPSTCSRHPVRLSQGRVDFFLQLRTMSEHRP